jgi:hypothetical protein
MMQIPVGKMLRKLFNSLLPVLILASSIPAASETKTGGGSYDDGANWTNPGNVTGAGDNNCATFNGKAQDQIVLYNFGFNIPSDATIDSIYVYVDGYGTHAVAGKRDFEVQLTKTGGGLNSGVGDLEENVRMPQALTCSSSGEYSIEGNGLWGTTWSYSEINAISFGVIIKDDDTGSSELGLDAVKITVVYSEAGGAANSSSRRKKIPVVSGRI